MDSILQWSNEVAYLHQDLYDDCTTLSKQINQSLQLLLKLESQEKRLDNVSSTLNELTKEDQIYSKVKLKLAAHWEKIKNEKNFPISTINEIFNDKNIISQNEPKITEQAIKTTKENIIKICSPFKNDITSVDKIFYDEFYSIANSLQDIRNNTKKSQYNYNSKKKTHIYDKILEYFYPNTSIFNLYVSINNQQKFLLKFREEIDIIATEEARENVPNPIIKPPTMNNPPFMQTKVDSSFLPYKSSLINDDMTFKLNQIPQNNLRNSINSPYFMQKRSTSQISSSQPLSMQNGDDMTSKNENYNLRLIIEKLQKEKKELEDKVEHLTGEVKNLTGEVKNLTGEVKNLTGQVEYLTDQLDLNEQIINELATGNESMQQTIEKLQDENNTLQALLDDS